MSDIDIPQTPTPEAVADSTGPLAYAVQAGAWTGALPVEVSDFVAPPIVVSAAPVRHSSPVPPVRRRSDLPRYRMNVSAHGGRHRRPARVAG